VVSVTAIIVALGDDPQLPSCLSALASEDAMELEVAVVENGASGPPPVLRHGPDIRLRRPENPGFAAAVNEALARTRGEHVLVLNPDATLLQGSLSVALTTLGCDPRIGAVAFRLLRPGGSVLDSAGIRLGLVRRARDRGMGRPAARRFLRASDVDGACMACALFRRSALEAARDGAGEVLDSRFFAYKEDVDLCWRLRRAGFRVVYEPRAVAFHERGWKERSRSAIPHRLRVLSFRNRWLMIAKNEPALSFVLRLALYVPYEVLLALWLLLREPRVLAAYAEIAAEIGESLRRRPLWQRNP
jgi:GT2 family glycosyltransferase